MITSVFLATLPASPRPLITSMKLWLVWVGRAFRLAYRPKDVPRGMVRSKVR